MPPRQAKRTQPARSAKSKPVGQNDDYVPNDSELSVDDLDIIDSSSVDRVDSDEEASEKKPKAKRKKGSKKVASKRTNTLKQRKQRSEQEKLTPCGECGFLMSAKGALKNRSRVTHYRDYHPELLPSEHGELHMKYDHTPPAVPPPLPTTLKPPLPMTVRAELVTQERVDLLRTIVRHVARRTSDPEDSSIDMTAEPSDEAAETLSSRLGAADHTDQPDSNDVGESALPVTNDVDQSAAPASNGADAVPCPTAVQPAIEQQFIAGAKLMAFRDSIHALPDGARHGQTSKYLSHREIDGLIQSILRLAAGPSIRQVLWEMSSVEAHTMNFREQDLLMLSLKVTHLRLLQEHYALLGNKIRWLLERVPYWVLLLPRDLHPWLVAAARILAHAEDASFPTLSINSWPRWTSVLVSHLSKADSSWPQTRNEVLAGRTSLIRSYKRLSRKGIMVNFLQAVHLHQHKQFQIPCTGLDTDQLFAVASSAFDATRVGHDRETVHMLTLYQIDEQYRRAAELLPPTPSASCSGPNGCTAEVHLCFVCWRGTPCSELAVDQASHHDICIKCDRKLEPSAKLYPQRWVREVLKRLHRRSRDEKMACEFRLPIELNDMMTENISIVQGELLPLVYDAEGCVFLDGLIDQTINFGKGNMTHSGQLRNYLRATVDGHHPFVIDKKEGVLFTRNHMRGNINLISGSLNIPLGPYPKYLLICFKALRDAYDAPPASGLINTKQHSLLLGDRAGQPVNNVTEIYQQACVNGALLPDRIRCKPRAEVWRLTGKGSRGSAYIKDSDFDFKYLYEELHRIAALPKYRLTGEHSDGFDLTKLWLRDGVFAPFSVFSVLVGYDNTSMLRLLAAKLHMMRNDCDRKEKNTIDRPDVGLGEFILTIAHLWFGMLRTDLDLGFPPQMCGRDGGGWVPLANILTLLCWSVGHNTPGEAMTTGLSGYNPAKRTPTSFVRADCNMLLETYLWNGMKWDYPRSDYDGISGQIDKVRDKPLRNAPCPFPPENLSQPAYINEIDRLYPGDPVGLALEDNPDLVRCNLCGDYQHVECAEVGDREEYFCAGCKPFMDDDESDAPASKDGDSNVLPGSNNPNFRPIRGSGDANSSALPATSGGPLNNNPIFSEDQALKPRNMQRVGDSCFISAALQVALRLPSVQESVQLPADILITGRSLDDEVIREDEKNGFPKLSKYYKSIQALYEELLKDGSSVPSSFTKVIRDAAMDMNPSFRPSKDFSKATAGYNDAAEFLGFTLQQIVHVHDRSDNAIVFNIGAGETFLTRFLQLKRLYENETKSLDSITTEARNYMAAWHKTGRDSKLARDFDLHRVFEYACPKCGIRREYSTSHIQTLSVPGDIPPNQAFNMRRWAEETEDHIYESVCDICQSHVTPGTSEIGWAFLNTPKFLVVRVDRSYGSVLKQNRLVDPDDTIDLEHFMTGRLPSDDTYPLNTPTKYRRVSVVASVGGNHYVGLVRRESTESWLLFDDFRKGRAEEIIMEDIEDRCPGFCETLIVYRLEEEPQPEPDPPVIGSIEDDHEGS
ncbi:uncharacterized protein AB675_1209 [Cyphellophora attinorum]|uniref:USP domain-containing protein n=1 Tax=Cyphellophora attinorum TaxID=1664694 RepID=A0A0N1NVU7_9EURO|nr:uncharacterized protein AB675_1209 [Phialophora attinorum]KPI35665.1 hypothetical protein AB675_1209 [Phialophora attinorum]